MGVADDEEGVGVNIVDRALDLHDLLLLKGHQQHLLGRPGPASLALENGDAPVLLLQQGVGNGLPAVRNDIGHLGGVQSIEHRIHDS